MEQVSPRNWLEELLPAGWEKCVGGLKSIAVKLTKMRVLDWNRRGWWIYCELLVWFWNWTQKIASHIPRKTSKKCETDHLTNLKSLTSLMFRKSFTITRIHNSITCPHKTSSSSVWVCLYDTDSDSEGDQLYTMCRCCTLPTIFPIKQFPLNSFFWNPSKWLPIDVQHRQKVTQCAAPLTVHSVVNDLQSRLYEPCRSNNPQPLWSQRVAGNANLRPTPSNELEAHFHKCGDDVQVIKCVTSILAPQCPDVFPPHTLGCPLPMTLERRRTDDPWSAGSPSFYLLPSSSSPCRAVAHPCDMYMRNGNCLSPFGSNIIL